MWTPILMISLIAGASSETFVQLMEWRFEDIANECETFLSKNGYTGVQVSPVMESAVLDGRPWYERYQPFSYKIISRSGDAVAFKNMCDRCSKVGIKIIVDVLMNHMTANLPSTVRGTNGSVADTLTKTYPAVPYTSEHFHPTCDIGTDYNNATKVRVCELVALHDLDQKQEYVREKLIAHLNQLIDLGATGFRIDAAKHMYPDDIELILRRTKPLPNGGKLFVFQEVPDDGGPEAIKPTDYFKIGLVTEFRYGTDMYLKANLSNKANLTALQGFGSKMMDSDQAVVFIDNHDRQRDKDRALSFKLPSAYKAANAFMLAWPYGKVKKIMSSYSFSNKDDGPPHNNDWTIKEVLVNGSCGNGWVCEHRWPEISAMVRFAQEMNDTKATNFTIYPNNAISFQRPPKGFFYLSVGVPTGSTLVQTGLKPGKYCDVISEAISGKSCGGSVVEVKENGWANITAPTQVTNKNFTIIALSVNAKGAGNAILGSTLLLLAAIWLTQSSK
uniref:Alpha-amylase n=1 Tax=Lygus hesperus TaxID=30085 RepID=A0A0A9XYF7_LYGHE